MSDPGLVQENDEEESGDRFPPPPPPPGQRTSLPYVQSPLQRLNAFAHRRYSAQGYRRLSNESDAAPLAPRPSILLPHLQHSEKKFFELVTLGDVNNVKQFLQENPGFNINCVNFQGISALHLAVQSRNEGIVEFLLAQRNIDIGDCVLHSVRDNQLKILKMLLEKLQETAPGLEFVGVTHSSDFPDHVTPLILAAQCGHFEIIEMLIERGHQISKPHPPDCLCSECKIRLENDDLLHSETLRLNLYRAVTNPAYICHSTHDPILTAFQLSQELRKCAMIVPEFRAAYNQLAADISTFAVELIGCCRSSEEMELILRQKTGLTSSGQYLFPRLVLAMDYKQKEFVAHPNTQQILESAWHGDWYEWKLKTNAIRALYPIYRLIMLPVIAIMCVVVPRNALVKHWDIPLNKMISHNAAYILFLIIIFLESDMDKAEQKRRPPSSGLEPVIVLYVIGNIWSCCRLCAIEGPRRYFRKMWSWHSLIMYFLFVCTFLFWIVSVMDVKHNDQLDLERKYWHHLDPVLLAEGTFAIATIMAYFRLLFLCRLNYYLGPLQISLGKMSADIAKYMTIFVIIIFAFTIGLCKFYQYYGGMVQTDEASGIKTAQVSSFVDFRSTLKTFFWALFCMSPLESADVIIENLPGETENTTIINKHTFTEAIGYIAFALFEVLTVIIILNMLIATMSNTFQRVTDNVDVEWTFGKTEFYLEYVLQTTLPSPFNLIPTANGLMSAVEWFQVFARNPPDRKARCTPGHCCFIDVELDEQLAKDFPILMSQLVQRYFREKDASAESTVDLEVLKQDIAEIRQMLSDYIEED
ncbi:hypothetical protein ILUMI_08636 [Ignelater luminosus]|uniref:Transient receptor ion channel domain-containing protein n=1 Tax=Ignelater luminosus TaxID=2038154 RepID=A0A8K0GGU4_IGNLU|nr:hypothetical protein ILUMI_08636 [Ignelater luminosus]